MLSEENSKYTLYDQLINNNIRFAVYKLPFSDNIELILQISEPKIQYNDILSLHAKRGFVIAPFSISKQYPIVIIDSEIKIGGEDKILDYIDQLKLPHGKEPSGTRMLTAGLDSFEKYRSVFDLFHNNIVEGKLQKLVLSRTLDIDKRNDWSAGITFNKACKKYTQNFVYLCHTPETGTWLGCSPEVIIAGHNNEWKTDALAGTQKISTDSNVMLWDLKNAKEQAIVSDYIQRQLEDIDIDVVKEEPQTIRSGDLIHLRSEFRFSMENKEKLGSILNALHPTPAVSGYPKEDASRFIQNNEGYERAYYAGFVGPLDIDDRTDLYVNLRCMQITTDTLRLYAGGGIMPESEAQSEWLETEYKLQTILSILEKTEKTMFSVKKNVLETVALLKAYGVNQIVLCPGSRNAPLIQTFSNDPFFTCHVIVDERNAAFYALGIIQATKKTVVVCCTSGSALLNFAPAVSEAFYQKLPLVVISADRSPEWIGQMDGQTIPQAGAFGSLSKKSVQLPEVKTETDLWYCNRIINEALIVCQSNKAPVHINIPISEPLFDYSISELPSVRKIHYTKSTKLVVANTYIEVLNRNSKILLVVGQGFYNDETLCLLEKLVEKINCVVVVEHLSNCISNLFVSNADTLLSIANDTVKESLKPDVLISIGGHIVSKKLKFYLRQYKPQHNWFVSETSDVVDLYQSLTDLIESDSDSFLRTIIEEMSVNENNQFYSIWKSLSEKIVEPANFLFSDITVTGDFLKKLPTNADLHLANSSVIRNAQLFKIEDSVRVFCDRGTNGIESSLPNAIGFASVSDNPVFLAIGDLSFFYTVGALWNIQHIKNLRILLINNQSGGIFHLLPGLDKASSLKKYVAAEHQTSAQKWAEAAELKYLSASNEAELDKILDLFVSTNNDQSVLLEVFTDIETSKKVSQEYYNKLKTNI